MSIKIDISWVMPFFQKEINKRMRIALDFLEDEIIKWTPEDTWVLINNYEKWDIIQIWDKTIWYIENNTDYAWFVEYWVWKKYNYYKNWWRKRWWSPFYSWVWARMITKAFEWQENINKVKQIFNK